MNGDEHTKVLSSSKKLLVINNNGVLAQFKK